MNDRESQLIWESLSQHADSLRKSELQDFISNFFDDAGEGSYEIKPGLEMEYGYLNNIFKLYIEGSKLRLVGQSGYDEDWMDFDLSQGEEEKFLKTVDVFKTVRTKIWPR